jgi:hypothetical protein
LFMLFIMIYFIYHRNDKKQIPQQESQGANPDLLGICFFACGQDTVFLIEYITHR